MDCLLVEDHEIAYELEVPIIESFGINVDIAYNGEEAIEKARKKDYSIIFMDILMPSMDGFTATKAIRKFNKTVPIIALSTDENLVLEENFQQAQINEILKKPITIASTKKIIDLCNKKYFNEEKIKLAKKFVHYVDKEKLKEFIVDEKALMQILYQFISIHKKNGETIRKLVENKKFTAANNVINNLIGMAGNLYCIPLYNVMKTLGFELQKKQDVTLDKFTNIWKKTVAELAEMCNIIAMQREYIVLEDAKWEVIWKDFYDLCKDFDTEAVALFRDNRSYFLKHISMEDFKRIRKATNRFNFIWLIDNLPKIKWGGAYKCTKF